MRIANNGQGGRYLHCSNARRLNNCGSRRNFSYETLEGAILDYVSEFRHDELLANTRGTEQAQRIGEEIAATTLHIADLKRREERLLGLFEQGEEDNFQAVKDRLREHWDNIKAAQQRLTRLEREREKASAKGEESARANFVIDRLKADLAAASDNSRYQVRARLASALRNWLDAIRLDSHTGSVTVFVVDGLRSYLFEEQRITPVRGGYKRILAFKGLGHSVCLSAEGFAAPIGQPNSSARRRVADGIINHICNLPMPQVFSAADLIGQSGHLVLPPLALQEAFVKELARRRNR